MLLTEKIEFQFMKQTNVNDLNDAAGFSLVELLIAMTITLILMGTASTLLTSSLATRMRENQKSDALANAQRVLNIMSREIANSGFGLTDNGIVIADSSAASIHIRANITNINSTTDDLNEDVTYEFQPANSAIVQYDRYANAGAGETISLASRINALTLSYTDYTINQATGALTVSAPSSTPSANTARVTINIEVTLNPIAGQPASSVRLTSDVALRNSSYVLTRY